MFQDIGDQYLVSDEHVTRGTFLGKGAFGAVYAGSMIEKVTQDLSEYLLFSQSSDIQNENMKH